MNVCRILTTAAAGSFLPAATATTAAQAVDLGSTLTSTALTAQAVGEQAAPVAHGVAQETGVGQQVAAVNNAVQSGAAAVSVGNQINGANG
jgi:hypothetical protein